MVASTAKGLDNSNLDTGAGDDTISINTNANSDGGWAGGTVAAMPIPSASTTTPPSTLALVTTPFTSIPSHQVNTNAWAIRDSSIDVGSGDDYVSLNATTFQTQRRYDPANGSENSSIDLGSGNDRLFINANASGQGEMRAFGALDSTIDAGSGDDVVSIKCLSQQQQRLVVVG